MPSVKTLNSDSEQCHWHLRAGKSKTTCVVGQGPGLIMSWLCNVIHLLQYRHAPFLFDSQESECSDAARCRRQICCTWTQQQALASATAPTQTTTPTMTPRLRQTCKARCAYGSSHIPTLQTTASFWMVRSQHLLGGWGLRICGMTKIFGISPGSSAAESHRKFTDCD